MIKYGGKGVVIMQENQMIPKPKLGLFQRIMKFFLLRKIDKFKYQKASKVLQDDSDVINALMEQSFHNLECLSDEKGLEYLSIHPEIFTKCSKDVRDRFLEKDPELFHQLSESQKEVTIFLDGNFDYIKQLSHEEQMEILTKGVRNEYFYEIKDLKTKDDFNYKIYQGQGLGMGPSTKIEIKPEYFYDKFDLFSEDVVIDLFLKFSKDYDYKNMSNPKKMKDYNKAQSFFYSVNLGNLPKDLQLKLALIDERLLRTMSEEVVVRFVGTNPLLLDLLPEEKKNELISNNPRLIQILSDKTQRTFFQNPKFRKYISPKILLFGDDNIVNPTYDEVVAIATCSKDSNLKLSYISNSVRNPDELWEIAQTIPQALACTGGVRYAYEKVKEVKDLLSNKTKNPKIIEAINSSPFFDNRYNNSTDVNIKQMNIYKVLTDEKAIQRCSQDKIVGFISDPTMEKLKDIIIETYGEHAKKILNSRPDLTMENIPNLKIFDEAIYDNFGEGVIHNLLSYDSQFSVLIADMANHPEKIQEYKKFERLTDGLFEKNIAGNETKFKSYIELAGLMKNLNEEDMTSERVEALKLAISDLDFGEARTIPLETVSDLDEYVEARNKMYDDAAKKTISPLKLKEIISKRIFGMRYESTVDNYRASNLSLRGLIDYYNIDNLLKDKRTYESDLFTEDELDMIELARIIDDIDDSRILSEIYESLSSRNEIISPVEMQSIKQKIPLQYSRELVSQLLTPEKVTEMIDKGEEGISVEHGDDNVDVIKLQGCDFKIMMHTMKGINGGETNSGVSIPTGKSADEVWKNFENGCSTISSCVIEPDMLNSCAYNNTLYNVGFCSIDPRLIIGMSHSDANTSHIIRDPNPSMGSIEMNYPEEFIRKTAAQITGAEAKDKLHEYNEVASYRREQDLAKITSENQGGRILPDYIIVFGESDISHRKLAKAFAKNGKPIPIIEIDREAYGDRKSIRAHKEDNEHKLEKREDSELISTVKNITSNDNEER